MNPKQWMTVIYNCLKIDGCNVCTLLCHVQITASNLLYSMTMEQSAHLSSNRTRHLGTGHFGASLLEPSRQSLQTMFPVMKTFHK